MKPAPTASLLAAIKPATPCFEPAQRLVRQASSAIANSLQSRCKTFAYGASIPGTTRGTPAAPTTALLLSTAGGLCAQHRNLLVMPGAVACDDHQLPSGLPPGERAGPWAGLAEKLGISPDRPGMSLPTSQGLRGCAC